MRVMELMRGHVVTTRADAVLHDAVDLMDLYQVSGLPVVDEEDALIGIVTEYDIIEALLRPYLQAADESPGPDLAQLVREVRSRTVREAMKTPVVSIDENADVLEAASLMLRNRIKRLPVTADGRLVGVIGRIDICQAILEDQLGDGSNAGDQ